MIVQSGNDASIALAEYIAGTESVFAEMMNQYAQALGMLSSNFVNSTGLPDDNHYSTARDLATLARAIISEFPEYYQWYSVKEFTFNDIRQPNRNNLTVVARRLGGRHEDRAHRRGRLLPRIVGAA